MSNSSIICVDASIVVPLVVGLRTTARVENLWREWDRYGWPRVAPALLHYELCNVLYRYVLHGDLQLEEAMQAFEIVLDLRIALYEDAKLHRQALTLANRFSLPAAYDAHYVALAERLGAELWTADRRLAQAVSGDLPWVHYVGDQWKRFSEEV
jgi:predicted nucleic acid-binding protein